MYKTPTSNFRIFVLAFGIFISNFPVFAHPKAVLLTQETSSKNISSLIEYRYRGQQFAGCSPDHIDGLEDLEWHQIPTEVLRVKRTPFGNWLRFSVKNSESTIQSRILLLGWLNVPDTQLCFFDKNGKFVSAKSGYSNRIEDQKILTNLPHFRIDIEPNESRIFYLFVLSNEDINYRIQIMGLEEFELRKRLRSIISYSIIGIVAIAIFYSLFGYYRFRNFTFVSFLLYIISVLITFYFLHGRTFAEIAGNTNNLFRHSYFLFLGISYVLLFLYLFSVDKTNQKKVYRSVFFWISGALGVLYFLIPLLHSWYDHRILLLVVTVGLSLFYFIRVHYQFLGPNSPIGFLYTASWAVFLVLDIYKTIFHFDFYPFNYFSVFGVVLFLPFHSILVSFSLNEFLNRKKSQKLEDKDSIQTRKSTISSLNVIEIVHSVKNLLEKKKVFLQKSLKEENVAKELGLSLHQLSEIINVEFGNNFPSLINQYRIEEAKKLLLDHPDKTTAEIGSSAGFSSKSAFYMEFKKFTGTNPNAYRRKELKNESTFRKNF
ncbi:helix-turn-helix domain-containing protein [Leptospira noguchii]|uniref:Helix-turn-helix domain-containing protein n=1 Tax=Leptospira noguchii TaxID=28182 RepID=A0A9Q8VW31_9LEPT|nr:helix-turn-helix domain-containing protein [Leptospira noguchii]TQE77059.1 helix-turn-helix domain-containing protein [Leptospira noguchii]UOG30479.1 helix-turn-helix domain-containing protein [Leptospira noguchii]UOG34178.1 helix-turn-helix domain-containing protein [Leptospira noguchii]UOG45043.1 helix-turn-helix domain-containing protein [Leptospira noguchii]UOG52615.1 helix-turn-helix domain-containing protein [Leptospira noguchii]